MNGENEKLVWSALEYEERERSRDWFWALGIIVVTASIASIIFGDYFFAALIIISGILLTFFAIKKPDTITYELNSKGLVIGSRLYPYENIKSFWVQIETKPLLFVHTERVFMPIMTIPIEENAAQEIYSMFSAREVAEVEMKEHPTDKIMEALGF